MPSGLTNVRLVRPSPKFRIRNRKEVRAMGGFLVFLFFLLLILLLILLLFL